MKKLFSLLLTLVLALVLVGCGKETTKAPEATTKAPAVTTKAPVVTTVAPQGTTKANDKTQQVTVTPEQAGSAEEFLDELSEEFEDVVKESDATGLRFASHTEVLAKVDYSAVTEITDRAYAQYASLLSEKYDGEASLDLELALDIVIEVSTANLTAGITVNLQLEKATIEGEVPGEAQVDFEQASEIIEEFFSDDLSVYAYFEDGVLYFGCNAGVTKIVEGLIIPIIQEVFGSIIEGVLEGITGADVTQSEPATEEGEGAASEGEGEGEGVEPAPEYTAKNFKIDFKEWLSSTPEEGEEAEEESPKAQIVSMIESIVPLIEGKTLGEIYAVAYQYLDMFGLLDEDGKLDIQTLISMIMSMTGEEVDEEDMEEMSMAQGMIEMLLPYIESKLEFSVNKTESSVAYYLGFVQTDLSKETIEIEGSPAPVPLFALVGLTGEDAPEFSKAIVGGNVKAAFRIDEDGSKHLAMLSSQIGLDFDGTHAGTAKETYLKTGRKVMVDEKEIDEEVKVVYDELDSFSVKFDLTETLSISQELELSLEALQGDAEVEDLTEMAAGYLDGALEKAMSSIPSEEIDEPIEVEEGE